MQIKLNHFKNDSLWQNHPDDTAKWGRMKIFVIYLARAAMKFGQRALYFLLYLMKINPKMNEDATFFCWPFFVKIRLICIFHLTVESRWQWYYPSDGWDWHKQRTMDRAYIQITGLDFSILWFYGLLMDET